MTTRATPSSRTQELVSLMFTTGRLIHEQSKAHRKFDPISVLQLESLRFIAERKQPTMKEVADHLSITPPSATSLIDALAKAKKIDRVRDAEDRRIVRLVLTTVGKKALEQGFKQHAKRIAEVLSKLNAQEQSHLVQILKKLQRAYQ